MNGLRYYLEIRGVRGSKKTKPIDGRPNALFQTKKKKNVIEIKQKGSARARTQDP